MDPYELIEGRLIVRTELDAGSEPGFREACDSLFRQGQRQMTIDLSGVRRIVSTNIGVISALWVDVLSEERDLRLIVSPQVRKVLEFAGFHHVFTLIDSPEPASTSKSRVP